MDFSSVVLLFGALLLAVVLLLAIWWIVIRRKTAKIAPNQVPPDSLAAESQAKFEPNEKLASLAGDQIKEQVKQRLKSNPDLVDVKIEFATGPDESLVISVNDQSHTEIDEISDDRIRAAIAEAVESFDR